MNKKLKKAPLVFFGLCLLLLSLSLWIAGQGPSVQDIEPRIAEPGEVLVITGNNFGEERGKVNIAGAIPVVSAYLEWTPRRIRLRIPEDASSGLVHVVTSKGQSEGVLFTNRKDIPVILRGAAGSQRPYINSMSPERSPVGSLLTISGGNFGYNRDESLVCFTWAPAAEAGALWADQKSRYIAASAETFDYESWSDREIAVRVPTGAGSGALMVRTAKGESNTVYFELDQSTGRRIFKDKRTYTLLSSVDIRNTSRRDGGGLYLWIPRIQESPSQRNVQLIKLDPPAEIENYNGLMLFYLKEPRRDVPYKISQTFILDRYTMESRIDSSRMPADYDTERPLYKAYTASNVFTPATDVDIAAAAKANGGREPNPYIRSRRLYEYVLARMSYSAPEKYAPAREGLANRKGDSYTYATLYVALLRSSGVPARTIAGYIVNDSNIARPHFWVEVYLPNFGWIPADPALGDRGAPENFPVPGAAAEYFFGNITNRHIAFSRGLLQAKKISPHGKTIEQPEMHSLQTIYAEAVGSLESYSGVWNNLQVIGAY
jgi:transglutaminase-like putative cysteine protease